MLYTGNVGIGKIASFGTSSFLLLNKLTADDEATLLDTTTNTITIVTNHFTEFAIVGDPSGFAVYLPFVMR